MIAMILVLLLISRLLPCAIMLLIIMLLLHIEGYHRLFLHVTFPFSSLQPCQYSGFLNIEEALYSRTKTEKREA